MEDNYLLRIGYLGTKYIGWQRQINVKLKSVQQMVEEAVGTNGTPKTVKGISRTDRGTHALCQLGLTRTDHELTLKEINARLPPSIRVYEIQKIPLYRFPLIKSKKYVYYIEQASRPSPAYAPYSWFISKKMNLDRLRAALSYLVGTHDFYRLSSGPKKRTTVRTIFDIQVSVRQSMEFSLDGCTAAIDDDQVNDVKDPSSPPPANYMICVEFIGDGFLQHMIRRIIGSVRPVAESNALSIDTLDLMRKGSISTGPAAPARGLWLADVSFENGTPFTSMTSYKDI